MLLWFLVVLTQILLNTVIHDNCFVSAQECCKYPWWYDDGSGKDECNSGNRQSPIIIQRSNVKVDKNSSVEFSNYRSTVPTETVAFYKVPKSGDESITSAIIFADPKQNLHATLMTGSETYATYNFHFLNIYFNCSEHKFDGSSDDISMLLEAHFVHYNREFGSLEQAMYEKNGLYIYATVFEKRHTDMPEYERTVKSYFDLIVSKNKKVAWSDLLPFKVFSPAYRYHGSITKAPCLESVVWDVDAEINNPIRAKIQVPMTYSQTPVTISSPESGNLKRCECPIPTVECRVAQPLKNRQVHLIRVILLPDKLWIKVAAIIIILLILIVLLLIGIIIKFFTSLLILIAISLILLIIFGFIDLS